MKLEWSVDALADLDRFAEFLHHTHPSLAPRIAQTLLEKVEMLSDHPQLGRPLQGRADFRQIVLHGLNATYVLQYRLERDRIVILRVFHHRERRP